VLQLIGVRLDRTVFSLFDSVEAIVFLLIILVVDVCTVRFSILCASPNLYLIRLF
jgi:hypothetical protein